jgi:hypothetical protein
VLQGFANSPPAAGVTRRDPPSYPALTDPDGIGFVTPALLIHPPCYPRPEASSEPEDWSGVTAWSVNSGVHDPVLGGIGGVEFSDDAAQPRHQNAIGNTHDLR